MHIPAFFMALAAVALLLALVALWQSLRSAFGAVPETEAGLVRSSALSALEEEKNTLLRAIKDLAGERDLGKISPADFERLDRGYRQRAKEVLRLLDQDLAPFMQEAEKMVGAASEAKPANKKKAGKKAKKQGATIACPACGAANEPGAAQCKSCEARIAPQACGACSTLNDPDAKFCKKCAARLGPEEPKPEEAKPGEGEADAPKDGVE